MASRSGRLRQILRRAERRLAAERAVPAVEVVTTAERLGEVLGEVTRVFDAGEQLLVALLRGWSPPGRRT